MRVLLEIGRVASNVADRATSAAEALELLHHITPYAAATITTWNPLTDYYQPLANAGYPNEIISRLDALRRQDGISDLIREPGTPPLRWRDAPFDLKRVAPVRELFFPSGFVDGVATMLSTPDGRPAGSLCLNTDLPGHPDDAAIEALVLLQPTLAGLVDYLRAPASAVADLDPAAGASIVTATGDVVALPGRALGSHLQRGSSLVELVGAMLRASSASGKTPALSEPRQDATAGAQGRRRHALDGLIPQWLWRDPAGGWHRVQAERFETGALVIETPTALPFELTGRELQVLLLMADGRSNPDIAVALCVTAKTVAKHVEHLLDKLECASRAGAAARAVTEGLLWMSADDGAELSRATVPVSR